MIVNFECFTLSQVLCLLFHSILKFISATSITHMFKNYSRDLVLNHWVTSFHTWYKNSLQDSWVPVFLVITPELNTSKMILRESDAVSRSTSCMQFQINASKWCPSHFWQSPMSLIVSATLTVSTETLYSPHPGPGHLPITHSHSQQKTIWWIQISYTCSGSPVHMIPEVPQDLKLFS